MGPSVTDGDDGAPSDSVGEGAAGLDVSSPALLPSYRPHPERVMSTRTAPAVAILIRGFTGLQMSALTLRR
jgi:hypothetical protein